MLFGETNISCYQLEDDLDIYEKLLMFEASNGSVF